MSQRVAPTRNTTSKSATRTNNSSKNSNANKNPTNKPVGISSRPSLHTEFFSSESESDDHHEPSANVRSTGSTSGPVSSSNKRPSSAMSNLHTEVEKVSRNSSLSLEDIQDIQHLDNVSQSSKDDRIKELELQLSLAKSSSVQSQRETPQSSVSSSNLSSASSSSKKKNSAGGGFILLSRTDESGKVTKSFDKSILAINETLKEAVEALPCCNGLVNNPPGAPAIMCDGEPLHHSCIEHLNCTYGEI